MAQTSKRYLKIGDHIVFYSETGDEEGFISIDSKTDDQCIIKNTKDKDCVFKIMPMSQYAAKETMQRRNQNAVGEEERKVLEAYQLENEANQTLEAQLDGKPIVYGQIIQLLHKRSNRLLSARERSSLGELESSEDWIRLEKEGSKRCWFKILPHGTASEEGLYELEGERVAEGDQIRLEHVLYGGSLFMTPNTEGAEGALYSLDLHPNHASYFTLQVSDLIEHTVNSLKQGSKIRLCHPNAGYLQGSDSKADVIRDSRSQSMISSQPSANSAFGPSVVCKFYHGGRATSGDAILSYSTVWVVELPEGAESMDLDVTWSKPIRLRLFGTALYLTIKISDIGSESPLISSSDSVESVKSRVTLNASQALNMSTVSLRSPRPEGIKIPSSATMESDEMLQVALTSNPWDQNALFALVPLRTATTNDQAIEYGSTVLLQNVSSKVWLHPSEALFGSTTQIEMKGHTESEIQCSRKFNYKDVFAVHLVPQAQVTDYEFVETCIPILKDYLNSVKDGDESVNEKDIVTVLGELICFCTHSDNIDPLTREGVPILSHQKLLGKHAVLDVVSGIAEVGPAQSIEVTRYAYKLLKLIAKNNQRNGTVLKDYLNLSFYAKGSAQTIDHFRRADVAQVFIEMYGDNDQILYEILPTFVEEIFAIIDKTRDIEFLKLLCALCRCSDTIIANNQKMICYELVKHSNIVPKRRISDGEIELQYSADDKWTSLRAFTADVDWNMDLSKIDEPSKSKSHRVLFYSAVLDLISTLCEGRNFTCQKMVAQNLEFSDSEAFLVMKDRHMDPRIRAKYAACYENLVLDLHPNTNLKTRFRRIWFTSQGAQANDDEGPVNHFSTVYRFDKVPDAAINTNDPEVLTLVSSSNPRSLSEFLLDFIFDKYSFRFDERQLATGHPQLLLRAMILVRKAFFFGIFRHKEHLLVSKLKEIIASNPLADKKDQSDEAKSILLAIKREALKIIKRYFEVWLNTVFDDFMKSLEPPGNANSEEKLKQIIMEQLLQKQQTAELVSDKFQLGSSLLAVLSHDDTQLTSQSLQLIAQMLISGNTNALLLKYIPKVQILMKLKEQGSHRRFEERLAMLQGLTAITMGPDHCQTVCDILEEFSNRCSQSTKDVNEVYQRICRNMNIHEEVLSILRRPIAVVHEDKKDNHMTYSDAELSIIAAGFKFLKSFCSENERNQRVLFKYLEFICNQMTSFRANEEICSIIMETITAMFKNNQHLCMKLSERQIYPFVLLAFERSTSPIYQELIHTIISPENMPLKANQNVILKMLIGRKETKALLSGTSHKGGLNVALTKMKSKKKIKREMTALTNEEFSLLRSGLIAVLALVCEGKNYFTEVTNQKLVSLEECLDNCLIEQPNFTANQLMIVQAYLNFMDEVYLNTESSVQVKPAVLLLQFNKKLWSLFEMMINGFKFIMAPSPTDERIYEQFFNNCLGFIQHFFARYFIKAKSTAEQKLTLQRLLAGLMRLTRKYVLNEVFYKKVQDTLRALSSAGLEELISGDATDTIEFNFRGKSNTNLRRGLDKEDLLAFSPRDESGMNNNEDSEKDNKREKIFKSSKKKNDKDIKMSVVTPWSDKASSRGDRDNGSRVHYEGQGAAEGSSTNHFTAALDQAIMRRIVEMMTELDRSGQTCIETMVYEIRNVLSPDIKLKILALRIVQAYITLKEHDARNSLLGVALPVSAGAADKYRRDAQAKLTQLEAPAAIVGLVTPSNPPALVDMALATLKEMLALEDERRANANPSYLKVNNKVKDTLIASLTSRAGGQRFFSDLVRILQTSRMVIKDYKRVTGFMAFGTRVRDRGNSYAPAPTDLAGFNLATALGGAFGTKAVSKPKVVESKLQLSSPRIFNTYENTHIVGNELKIGSIVPNMFLALRLMAQDSAIFKTALAQQNELLREIILYLKMFEGVLDESNVALAFQMFRTLTEIVKLSPPNQKIVLDAQVLVPVNKILSRVIPTDKDFADVILGLKITVMEFLLMLVDEAESTVISKVTAQLDLRSLENNTGLIIDSNELCSDKRAVSLAALSFRMVQILYDRNEAVDNKELQDSFKICESNCQNKIAHIEVMHKKQLHTIYFPVPTVFRKVIPRNPAKSERLNKKKEKTLMKGMEESLIEQNVDWKRAGEKLAGFVEWGHVLLLRQEQRNINKRRFGSKYKGLNWAHHIFWNLSFLVSLAVNIMLLTLAEVTSDVLPDLIFYTCIVGAVLSLFSTGTYFLKHGTEMNQIGWLKLRSQSASSDRRYNHKKRNYEGAEGLSLILHSWAEIRPKLGVKVTKYYARSFKHWVLNPYAIYLFLYTACAILGVVVSPYFYAFHLSQIILRSRYLLFILKALKQTIVSLLLMMLVVICFVFILSIFGFFFFQSYFNTMGLNTHCDTLLQCMLTLSYYGIPSEGGVFEYLAGPDLTPLRFAWVIFIIIFYFVIGLILLNVTLAILVDAFAQFREQYKEAKEEVDNSCFICSIQRDSFREKGIDFQAHIEKDHNLLHYLYFLAYLKEVKAKKETGQLSKVEREIYRQIKNRGAVLDFFPMGRSVALEKDETSVKTDVAGATSSTALLDRIDRLERKVLQLIGNIQIKQRN